MKDKLKKISEVTGAKFAEVVDGKAVHLIDSVEIPVEHMIYQTPPKDGIYRLSENTCDNYNGCEVGNHLKDCSGYSYKKCAVWSFYPPEKFSIDFNDCLKLMDGNNV